MKEQNSNSTTDQIILKNDLNNLPKIVQLWLNKVGIIGKNRISIVNLTQTGLMKLEPKQIEWYKPKAEQLITVNEPGFLWQVDLAMLPVIKTKGRDLFYQGNASMLIQIAYLLPIVDQKTNAKINESALHRFLLELPWYPTAALNDYLLWEEVNSTTARATINYRGTKAAAEIDVSWHLDSGKFTWFKVKIEEIDFEY